MRPIDSILPVLDNVKPVGDSGKSWAACCPAHDDEQHSLSVSIGDTRPVVMTCFAGCRYEAIRDALISRGVDAKVFSGEPEGVSVAELATVKRLPVEFLRSRDIGLIDETDGKRVGIPYRGEDGKKLRLRIRSHISATKGTYWHKDSTGTYAYGLWKLAGFREQEKVVDAAGPRTLIIVEGESDCWTLWYHGIPALGIPGSKSVKVIKPEHLDGFDRIAVWQEPDTAGREFVVKLAARLESFSSFTGAVVLVNGEKEKVKDLSDLHRREPEKFKERLAGMLADATVMPSAADLKKSTRRIIVAKSIQEKSESLKQLPIPDPGDFSLTDNGNAERLVNRHGRNIRYCHAYKSWMFWSGRRWEFDDTGEICRRMTETMISINLEAGKTDDSSDGKILREQLQRHAKDSESRGAIRAAIDLAKDIKGIWIKPEDMDTDPMLFNVLNGTIDLRTGELRSHRREDKISKLAPVEFDSKAECPIFMAFIRRIMGDDEDLIEFLQIALGYSLAGLISENCFFFCFGGGQNGKSTLIELIARMMGDYAGKTVAETILDIGNRTTIPSDVACLRGLRFVSCAELPDGKRMNESRLKDMTGKDKLKARELYGKWFEFDVQFALWMYGNHKPTIRGTDDGIWRRVRLIPFTVRIPDSEKDSKLCDKLFAESAGILNWMLAGCLKWQKSGIPVPDAVRRATEEYREDMDTLAEFISDRCELGEGLTCRVADLYESYVNWCESEKQSHMSKKAFGIRIAAREGIKKHRDSSNRSWTGIRVVPGSNIQAKKDRPNSDEFRLEDYD